MPCFVRSLFLLSALSTLSFGQANPPADQLQRANQLFVSGDWHATLSAYEALSKAFPNHALSRFRIGVAQLELGQLDAAETNLKEGERLGVAPGMAAFRLAQVHAKQGQGDKAFADLDRAAAAQLGIPTPVLDTVKHLASLKRDPRWAKAADQLDAWARPCLHDARHREFDFWIGDWDVRPTGQPPVGPAARNTVTLEYNGCIVVEHWNPGNGAGGESYNLYDRSIGMWRQTWVDAFGGQHDYKGNLKDGKMAYEGTVPAPSGQPGRLPVRLTFFKIGNDSVRQLGESTPDSGKTWQTSYDLMYVRRKQQGGSTDTLDGTSRAQILSLDSTFVRAWVKDDTAAVLGVFSADAVLQPPGAAALTGRAAIKSYWFPNDGSRTRILSFDHQVLEVTGSSKMAFVRGTSTLKWQYTKDGKTTEQTGKSTDLRVYAADPSGKWSVIRQMWVTVP